MGRYPGLGQVRRPALTFSSIWSFRGERRWITFRIHTLLFLVSIKYWLCNINQIQMRLTTVLKKLLLACTKKIPAALLLLSTLTPSFSQGFSLTDTLKMNTVSVTALSSNRTMPFTIVRQAPLFLWNAMARMALRHSLFVACLVAIPALHGTAWMSMHPWTEW